MSNKNSPKASPRVSTKVTLKPPLVKTLAPKGTKAIEKSAVPTSNKKVDSPSKSTNTSKPVKPENLEIATTSTQIAIIPKDISNIEPRIPNPISPNTPLSASALTTSENNSPDLEVQSSDSLDDLSISIGRLTLDPTEVKAIKKDLISQTLDNSNNSEAQTENTVTLCRKLSCVYPTKSLIDSVVALTTIAEDSKENLELSFSSTATEVGSENCDAESPNMTTDHKGPEDTVTLLEKLLKNQEDMETKLLKEIQKTRTELVSTTDKLGIELREEMAHMQKKLVQNISQTDTRLDEHIRQSKNEFIKIKTDIEVCEKVGEAHRIRITQLEESQDQGFTQLRNDINLLKQSQSTASKNHNTSLAGHCKTTEQFSAPQYSVRFSDFVAENVTDSTSYPSAKYEFTARQQSTLNENLIRSLKHHELARFKGFGDARSPYEFITEFENMYYGDDSLMVTQFRNLLERSAQPLLGDVTDRPTWVEVKQRFLKNSWSSRIQQQEHQRFINTTLGSNRYSVYEECDYWARRLTLGTIYNELDIVQELYDKLPYEYQVGITVKDIQTRHDLLAWVLERERVVKSKKRLNKKPINVEVESRISELYLDEDGDKVSVIQKNQRQDHNKSKKSSTKPLESQSETNKKKNFNTYQYGKKNQNIKKAVNNPAEVNSSNPISKNQGNF